jgi:gas vesicle protein
MSYAGKDPRSRRTTTSSAAGGVSHPVDRARSGSRAFEREISITKRAGASGTRRETVEPGGELDWQHIGLFAAGALVGAALGAGAALLLAPHSGSETRLRLARQGRHFRDRTADAWDDLRDELRYAARRSRRKLARRWERVQRERQLRRELDNGALLPD